MLSCSAQPNHSDQSNENEPDEPDDEEPVVVDAHAAQRRFEERVQDDQRGEHDRQHEEDSDAHADDVVDRPPLLELFDDPALRDCDERQRDERRLCQAGGRSRACDVREIADARANATERRAPGKAAG